MRKTAVTAYGLVGTDWMRVTLAILETGSAVFVRADGTNSIIPAIPSTFRTCGDMGNVMAQLGHRVDVSAVPSIGLKNHVWKGQYDLTGIVAKFAPNRPELVALVEASYAPDVQIAA